MNENSLSDDVVWSVYKDSNDNIWIGTYRGGLNKYDRKNNKFTFYKADPSKRNSLNDNHIRSLHMDKKGNLWIGTYSAGLNKYVPSEGRFYHYLNDPADKKSIGANQILKIEEDADGIMWIAAFGGGLNKFIPEKNEFVRYMHDPSDERSLRDDRVYSLHIDRKGNLWVGTFGGGLSKFNKETETFTHYFHKSADDNSLSHNRVMAICEDSNGMIWIGTHGGGLNKLDPSTNKIKRYGKTAGLSSDVVYGILEDKNKNIWLSSEDGIFRMNLGTEYISHFEIQDGLQGLEYSGGAYFKSGDGELFFGGINGLNYFYPENIVENQYIPPIVITSVRIFNESLNGDRDELQLKYNENFVSFEFAALDFTHPPDNHYQYMLEGLDKEWQYAKSNMRVATYTNLAPGDYVFRVKGSNNDDLWNTEGITVAISIMPPFWKTWWFIALAILLIGSALYFLSTVRIKNQLFIERLKTKLAADLHDNVGSGLTEISILSELAKHKVSNGGSNELKHISEISRHLVDNMSDIVWVVNPRRDSLYDLIIRLKDNYGEVLSSMGISFKTQNLEKLSSLKLPMEYRQNLYLIFKEAINNCIKHSGCKKLTLESNLRGDVLEIALKDDGSGFNLRDKNSGDGLKNIDRRAEEIGGKVKVKTSPEEGTTLTFLGRVPKSEAGFRRKRFS
jgi:streptogramin lyase/two-component sensor histidine kinase